MVDSSDSRILVNRCRAGDAEAARLLFECYVDRLVAVARRRLSQSMNSRVDAEDIVQSVFRTFFGRLKGGQFRLEQQDDLCKLLVRITVNKARRQVAYQKAAKRAPGQEVHNDDGGGKQLLQVPTHDPDPEEEVAFLDQLEHFLGRLAPDERRILEMRVQGHSNDDICTELGIYDRKIHRVLERIRGLAEREGWSPGTGYGPE
jgi:RNA polymerase sigma-70 factor (ECF subfamily)